MALAINHTPSPWCEEHLKDGTAGVFTPESHQGGVVGAHYLQPIVGLRPKPTLICPLGGAICFEDAQ